MVRVLLLVLFALPGFAWEVTVAFTTDLHASIPRLAALAPILAQADLVLDGGDAWEDLDRLTGPAEAWGAMGAMAKAGYSAMVLGNHELYLGPLLGEIIDQTPFPIIATNVSGDLPLAKAVVREVEGVRVLILGAFWEEYPWPIWPGLEVLDPRQALREALASAPPCDLFILLGHMQFSRAELLAQALPECDLFILGHNHRFLEEPVWVGGVPIVQAGHRGQAVGLAHLGPEGLESYELIRIPKPKDLPNFTPLAALAAFLLALLSR